MTDLGIGPIDLGDASDAVARRLDDSGLPYVRDAAVHGYRPDFLVQCAPDRKIVLDLKNWKPDAVHLKRAADQAKRIKAVTNSDEAYIVLSEPIDVPLPRGVIGLDALTDVLHAAASCDAAARASVPAALAPAPAAPAKTIFAAMPFAAAYEDVFFVAIAGAAEASGAAAKRVDLDPRAGDVVQHIEELIRASALVVADLSESRPNVMYEVGFARALEKPIVTLCSTALEDLPFDVRNWSTIPYEKGRTHELRGRLAERLGALLR